MGQCYAHDSSGDLGSIVPWTVKDVDKHKKGLSLDQKVRWVRIANAILEDEGDEALAIRTANKRVGSGTR